MTFKYVVNEMEHISGDDAWHEREELYVSAYPVSYLVI